MSTLATPPAPAAAPARRRSIAKPAIWAALGLAGISVLIYTDYPLFKPSADPYRAKLIFDRFFLIPHAVAGIVATCLGPFLFSTRFRQRHLKRHRIMGRVYVGCIAVAAPMAFYLGTRGYTLPMTFAGGVQAVFWFGCTLCAFLAARNRQITVHRQWMVRSYLFTLSFIFSRLPNPIPAYYNMSETGLALTLLFLSICYFALPQVYFNWHELTHSRA
ncbi:MAG: DUF2306 domain-containing protein [Acidobacteriaceae bacterium]|jgi:uncharacterized membrane protein